MNADVEIAELLAKDAERIVALRRFFEDGNTPSVAESLGRHEEGMAATLVRAVVLESLVLALARACDTSADAQPRDVAQPQPPRRHSANLLRSVSRT
jgi:hypothetical protein